MNSIVKRANIGRLAMVLLALSMMMAIPSVSAPPPPIVKDINNWTKLS